MPSLSHDTRQTLSRGLARNFLGQSPRWYKQLMCLFLITNPLLLWFSGPQGGVIVGWLLLGEFIFTLAMALKCYPLQPGGLLALEAVVIGMASPEAIMQEMERNLPVILLLMFMVAGIYFMKPLLLYAFTKIILGVRSKTWLSLMFCLSSALLSAFLDALTVTAVIIGIAVGFYSVYHKVASGKHFDTQHDHANDVSVEAVHSEDLEDFRGFLRSLLMHGAVGTALGGVSTMIGEPQNLVIAKAAEWDFVDFFLAMAPVTVPTFFAGLALCVLLERGRWFGYGQRLPASVRRILEDYDHHQDSRRTPRERAALIVQAVVAVLLVLALALHMAEVGLIGLAVIILLTAGNGITDEHQIGRAFQESLPFTSLLVVFFTIVAVIHEQHLFQPFIQWVLSLPIEEQAGALFLANGLLSAISDNVFVATVYITQVKNEFVAGNISREHFHALAVAVNTGTNLPSVATPNGQAAFLFLLTSAIAPLVRLSYGRMVWMALPYTVLMTLVGLATVRSFI